MAGSSSSGESGSGSASSPRASRLTDTSGMAPSVEIRLLQEAREFARAEAEASGSGRRARAPSLKLLEASGALEHEGAQWMTKEIKEADAKVKKELREQRKHFKAAGLKAGVVIEEFSATPPQAAGGANVVEAQRSGAPSGAPGDGGSGAAAGGSVSGDAEAEVAAATSGGWMPSSKYNWRKLTTAEILQETTGRQKPADGSMTPTGEGGAEVVGADADAAAPDAADAAVFPTAPIAPIDDDDTDGWSLKRAWVVSGTSIAAGNDPPVAAGHDGVTSSKRSWQQANGEEGDEEEGGHGSHPAGKAWRAPTAQEANGAGGFGGSGGGWVGTTREGEAGGGQSTCEHEDCSRVALFGVNGTVRYCKTHRLFGMHEITRNN